MCTVPFESQNILMIVNVCMSVTKPFNNTHSNISTITWKRDLAGNMPFGSCLGVLSGLGLSWEIHGLPCWASNELLGDANAVTVLSSALWADWVGDRNGFWTLWGAGFCTKSLPNLDNCWVTANKPPSATVMITQMGSEIEMATSFFYFSYRLLVAFKFEKKKLVKYCKTDLSAKN